MDRLRVIVQGGGGPAANMATDEALARSVAKGASGPVARFYRWRPYSLSFGYSQNPVRIVDPAGAAAAGIGLVRRMTGGRAVFHAEELTFFLAVPAPRTGEALPAAAIPAPGAPSMARRGDWPSVAGTFLDRFRALMEPLVEALRGLGLAARFASEAERRQGRGSRVHCYQAAAGHSVFLGERKLIGAAGVSRPGVLAVHGSIPLGPVAIPPGVFRDPLVEREAAGLGQAFLRDFLPPAVIEALPDLIASAWATALAARRSADHPTPEEAGEAGILARQRYSRLDWKVTDPG